ncbi:MAG TPA: Ger(x)C family spore germination protein, partial [Clostridia bacterium]|nr:Ger(x)C family spore germination protein [Clostridia bacterium]
MKTKLTRFVAVLVILLLAVTHAGCWSRIETNNLAIVTAIALDKTSDGQIRFAVEIVRPAVISGGDVAEGGSSDTSNTNEQPVLQIGSTGETPYDAWRNLQLQMGRMMFFAHTQEVIFGERLAREGVKPYLDFTERRFRLRRNVGFSITPGEAKEVLVATPLIEPSIGLALVTFSDNYVRQSKALFSNFASFYSNLYNEFTHPTASKISLHVLDPETGHSHVKFAGAAVFKEDRLVGWLNEKETRGLNRILGHMGRGTVIPVLDRDDDKKISIVTARSRTEIKALIRDGQPVIKIRVNEEGEIADMEPPVDITSPEFMDRLNIGYGEAIKEEVNAAVLAAQQIHGVDILEFGKAVRRQENSYWKKNKLQENWGEFFPDLQVELIVDAKIRRVGVSLYP